MGKAVLRWTAYWLIILFLYVALSLYFGSFLYYAMLLVVALCYFVLRLFFFLPFFGAILQKQSAQAVFVGHDHLNNLGVKYKGVDLIYGKSIDYIAYPRIASQTAQRGGTLITVLSDGYMTCQISLAEDAAKLGARATAQTPENDKIR